MPSKLKKRGENSWLLTVSHQGEDFTKTIHAKTKLEAEKAWTLFSAKVINGEAIAKKEGKMTLNQFYRYWLTNYAQVNLEVTTQALNENLYLRIGLALGEIEISALRPRHVLAFLQQLLSPTASVNNTPLSQAYIKKHIALLDSLLNSAVDWEFIAKNPLKKLKIPKNEKTKKVLPSEEELSRFFCSLEKHDNLKHNLWILLAFTLGLRREEIFGIQWGDIDLTKRTLTINRAVVYVPQKGILVKSTKTKSGLRSLPLHKTLVAFLHSWKLAVIDAHNRRTTRKKIVPEGNPVANDNFIFTKPDGTVAHPHSFNTFLRKYCQKINIPVISPHDLRHLYGTYLLAGGINIATISSLLGHSNKSFTLETYIHEVKSIEYQSADVISTAVEKIKILEK